MATADLTPEEVPPEVTQAAERNQVGRFRRVLTRVKVPVFGRVKVTGSVYDFEAGIIYEDENDVLHAFPYDKIANVFTNSTLHFVNGSYNRTYYGAGLSLVSGGHLRLSGSFNDPAYARGRRAPVERQEEHEIFLLLSSVATIVSRAKLPDAVARLERGEELAFGDVRIGLAGVRTEDEIIPWASVKDVQVHEGRIRFKQAGKFRPLSSQQVGQVPNLPLFFMLVNAIRESQPPG